MLPHQAQHPEHTTGACRSEHTHTPQPGPHTHVALCGKYHADVASTRMQVLLEACIRYDEACEAAQAAAAAPAGSAPPPPPPLPPLLVVITGRGPLQAEWRETLARRRLRHVSFFLVWLSPEQYATLLACADLGVSLHASSSGLDLPMKVSDMLGWCVYRCGPPVGDVCFLFFILCFFIIQY